MKSKCKSCTKKVFCIKAVQSLTNKSHGKIEGNKQIPGLKFWFHSPRVNKINL